MIIYSMTATFGKLENETLTLKPGLNVIHAPNEWGKSTWCAFLVNMLYGLETRVKSTKAALADKERFAPWSGSPMSGRVELNWNGRNITIERWTKGRTPMGEFRAYETESGVTVPELTASTCGEMLLGVERSVFLRSGFLRLADLPVSDDEQLRRRLNALVTTGDENDGGDVLAQRLKELKNKIRYNRTGLLPAAEKNAEELEESLWQLAALQEKTEENDRLQQDLKEQITQLENHKLALQYAAEEENQRRITQAQLRKEQTQKRLTELESACAHLPEKEKCRLWTEQLRKLHQQTVELDMEQQMLPPALERPCVDGSISPEQASEDRKKYLHLQEKSQNSQVITKISLCAAVACAIGLNLSLIAKNGLLAALTGALLLGCAVASWYFGNQKRMLAREMAQLVAIYHSEDVAQWVENAHAAQEEIQHYEQSAQKREQAVTALWEKRERVKEQIQALTGGEPISQCMEDWERTLQQWEKLEQARQSYENACGYADTVTAMAKPLKKPANPDLLTYTMEQTQKMLLQDRQNLENLGQQQGNYRGRMETMGQESLLREQLAAVRKRIDRLSETYAALELAQTTLAAATAELQRRFAPQIAKEAQNMFGKLTGGRYDRLTICQDLSLQAGAEEEGVLHTAQWRSEGTVDQMYFALRLAVSKALTPDAPLVLDDALVRFDDERHAAAMNILKEEAENRQIILFTCQEREEKYQKGGAT